MSVTIQTVTFEGQGAGQRVLDRVADVCPICHRHIEPKMMPGYLRDSGTMIEVVFTCTNNACKHLFIGAYYQTGGTYSLISTAPTHAQPVSIPNEVAEVSPQFVEIMKQTAVAEASNLDQLVGIGLRKALEFLIKDFVSRKHPADVEKIKNIQLGTCISNYVDDPRLKSVAARAAWLGNDETHYVRKWENKDISDLKTLVKLTENWIHSDLLTTRYEMDMPK